MVKELTQKFMITQLHTFLVGLNGDGFIKRDREWKEDMEKKLVAFHDEFVTHREKTAANCEYLSHLEEIEEDRIDDKEDNYRNLKSVGICMSIITPWVLVALSLMGVITL